MVSPSLHSSSVAGKFFLIHWNIEEYEAVELIQVNAAPFIFSCHTVHQRFQFAVGSAV
jgi:hypothetical protein